jgi:hypothetical protein
MFFPPNIFHDNDEYNASIFNWYGKHLTAMQEPALWEMAQSLEAHVYRFLWLRTFHHPIAIRLMVTADGTGILTAKRLDGMGGYEPGNLVQNETQLLSTMQVEEWLSRLEQMDYWNMHDGGIGLDGAQWILEGGRNGKYHLVDQHRPETGAFREAALLLVRWAAVPVDEIY